jgi:hypothetical protein
LYEDYFHDPLNDTGSERVLADVTGWIEARLGEPAGARTRAAGA